MKKVVGAVVWLTSPWVIQLGYLVGREPWFDLGGFHPESFLANLSDYLSVDMLFLVGDPRIRFSTHEQGWFYLSWLPFLIYGSFKERKLWLVAAAGLLVASLLGEMATYSGALLFVPVVQLIVSRSVVEFWGKHRRVSVAILVLFLYEVVSFVHVLAVHYPQKLAAAGIG